MKSRNKQLPSASYHHPDSQQKQHYQSLKPMSKKPSLMVMDLNLRNQSTKASHMPLSTKHTPHHNQRQTIQRSPISLSKSPHRHKHHHDHRNQDHYQESSYASVKSSPYIHLPSLPSQPSCETRYYQSQRYYDNNSNSQNDMKLSNVSSSSSSQYNRQQTEEYDKGCYYYSVPSNHQQKQGSQKNFQKPKNKQNSVYDQLCANTYENDNASSPPTEESHQDSQQHNPDITTKRKHPKCQHKPISSPQESNIKKISSNTMISREKSQQMIKRHISDKIDRVCEKIDGLSREKQGGRDGGSRKGEMTKEWEMAKEWERERSPLQSLSNLCYSNIVYQQPSTTTIPQPITKASSSPSHPPSTLKLLQNTIHHRTLPLPSPTHSQLLQSKLIEMDRKISSLNSKVIRLEEELLLEKEMLIRKEKEWLKRENQLLVVVEGLEDQMERGEQERQDGEGGKHETDKVKRQVLCEGLSELLNDAIRLSNQNQTWLNLMNRTASDQLPAQAFTVKQQLNHNQHFLTHLQHQCFTHLQKLDHLLSSSPPPANNSQVFLLQSYCPPSSSQPPATQRYQILQTRRNLSSNVKQSSRKSLLCVSESKSLSKSFTQTTNKKARESQIVSTQKKSNHHKNPPSSHNSVVKSKLNREKEIGQPCNSRVTNKALFQQSRRRSILDQNYCDQVFYEHRKVEEKTCQQQAAQQNEHHSINDKNSLQMQKQQLSNYQLYLMLSLQAEALESYMINQKHSKASLQQEEDDEQEEENLLLDSTIG